MNEKLAKWSDDDLKAFLQLRQELFLDPLGSNRVRFQESFELLTKALFTWYQSQPNAFDGILPLLIERMPAWRALRKVEAETLWERRFLLNSPLSDVPAVEGGVSEDQWQRILGSLTLDHGHGSFDRFLKDLDEFSNPSLRINHRYVGELLPHDNMVSYFSAVAATFLNENAVIGKVSPCITHMEDAAMRWFFRLIGWDAGIKPEEPSPCTIESPIPCRLPTPFPPGHEFDERDREYPVGTVVSGGTIANVTALLVARNATFNYLLGWGHAVESLGPTRSWEIIRNVYGYEGMAVFTSPSAHYSVKKAAQIAGIGPLDVIDVVGKENPWVMDKIGLEILVCKECENLEVKHSCTSDKQLKRAKKLIVAAVPIAGTTEAGYVDKIQDVVGFLSQDKLLLPDVVSIDSESPHWTKLATEIEETIGKDDKREKTQKEFDAAQKARVELFGKLKGQSPSRYSRAFIHADAAHGGGFLASEKFRTAFDGIESVDSITIDGHKMFYCYYPCGGLLVRFARWAQTLHAGRSTYISEETNDWAYKENQGFLGTRLHDPIRPYSRSDQLELAAIHRQLRGPTSERRSELLHEPYKKSLEGSRGGQGIMQLYFNIHTLGKSGYGRLCEWTHLLARRCEDAVRNGNLSVGPVTEPTMSGRKYTPVGTETKQSGGVPDESPKPDALRPAPQSGRFLVLSEGCCNQVLISYVPKVAALQISTWSDTHWAEANSDVGCAGHDQFWRIVYYLWRVNEHLWFNHLYANPAFTYYVGHTDFGPRLPAHHGHEEANAAAEFAELVAKWNPWSHVISEVPAFFTTLATKLTAKMRRQESGKEDPQMRFFALKIIVMHPYTDESILSDLLGKLAFWGERSAEAIDGSDAACRQWLDLRRP